jgi:2-polyprenyl-6-hydroxyphenyl methylase / 3-demethylubiquinone-9 3-methyltransferase
MTLSRSPAHSPMSTALITTGPANADPAEVGKFDALAQRWWDPAGEFAPLHRLNPLRLGYVEARAPLAGRRVLDVGCGGGILSEAMAKRGAHVLGIDLAPAALQVAELHALEGDVAVAYRKIAAEQLAAEVPGAFDMVTCMEMLEHVPDPASVIAALAKLVKPGGDVFVSTINRNAKAFLLAIVGAEYVLRMLPRGTHDYERFIRPSELARGARVAGLQVLDVTGMEIDPLTRDFRLGTDVSVNYLAHLRRPADPT